MLDEHEVKSMPRTPRRLLTLGMLVLIAGLAGCAGGAHKADSAPPPQATTTQQSAPANDLTLDEMSACFDRSKLVATMIMDPRDAGKSKKYVLAKISKSKLLNAKEKRIMLKTADATFEYNLDDFSVVIWSQLNCTTSLRSGVDFALPIEKHAMTIQVCGAVGRFAGKAAVERAKGVSYKQFMSDRKRYYPVLSADQEQFIRQRGAQAAYGAPAGREPALIRGDAVRACLRQVMSNT